MSEKNIATEKRPIRFNMVDVVIILVVIACIAGVVLRLGVKENQQRIEGSDNRVVCTLLCQTISEQLITIKAGDILYNDQTGAKLGEVTAVRQLPAVKNELGADGAYVAAQYSNRYDLYIDVLCNVMARADGLYIEGTTLCTVGSELPLRAQGFYFDKALISDFVQQQNETN